MNELDKHMADIANIRSDFALIANWVNRNAKVLDLGCGDGALLTHLHQVHDIRGYGVEKDDANWLIAMQNGVDVIQMNLEEGLSGFEDNSFDTVILSQTIGVTVFSSSAGKCLFLTTCHINGMTRLMCIYARLKILITFATRKKLKCLSD
jgi:SAM-dependent methyltransferase